MSVMTGGEVVARCLELEGARYVFGIPGDQLYPLLDALGSSERVKFLAFRQEQAAAHAADAWARTTGQPGVCLGTVGPGAADLVPGVYRSLLIGQSWTQESCPPRERHWGHSSRQVLVSGQPHE